MNHGTIVAIIHIADAFFEEICDLHVGEFAFERNRYVEDQVCVGRTFYYAKIVNGKTTVQIASDFFNLAAYFIDLPMLSVTMGSMWMVAEQFSLS